MKGEERSSANVFILLIVGTRRKKDVHEKGMQVSFKLQRCTVDVWWMAV